MPLSPQKLREIVLQMLYSHDLSGTSQADEALKRLLMKELQLSKSVITSAEKRQGAVLDKCPEIDKWIAEISKGYAFDRIQAVERNILRLGVYELFFDEGIPPKVAIAEAIRLTRKFSSPEAASFVNAILDALYQKSLGQQVDRETLQTTSDALAQSETRAQQAIKDAPGGLSDSDS